MLMASSPLLKRLSGVLVMPLSTKVLITLSVWQAPLTILVEVRVRVVVADSVVVGFSVMVEVVVVVVETMVVALTY